MQRRLPVSSPLSTVSLDTVPLHLRNGGTSVVLDLATEIPTVVWWGEDQGELSDADLVALATASVPQRVSGGLDRPSPLTLLPLESSGWQGTPGLTGHRNGRQFSASFTRRSMAANGAAVDISASDDQAGLRVGIECEVTAAGLFRQRITLTNTAADPYTVTDLHPSFPLPAGLDEILDTTGRHLKERSPQRHAFTIGTHLRESRRGRPGADASLLLTAGRTGFGFESGLAFAVHAAWSGNHRLLAERTSGAHSFLAAGELILPGEILLGPGEEYQTPWAIGSWGDGLTELSARFHTDLRARPSHPARPRPVTLNTWEAVYFDHDADRIDALLTRAATVGVERFVLDDGWFLGRRDDHAGLGDWQVDTDVWPDGLHALIDNVHAHGMEFGLWVEPEMVNLDSDLARSHPDWILRARTALPVSGRQQHVLNLAHPAAFAHVFEQLHALLTEYDIAYLKWDHNRDLLEAGDGPNGRAVVHEGVDAVYRMMDDLKRAHPGLEIESCASGGARVDLGILEHTDRIWTSDCLDPFERLGIQKYTGILVPTELMGAHLTTPLVHSTGRTTTVDFSGGVALFGHFGIEWDLTTLDQDGLDAVAAWVQRHKRFRPLLHTGRMVHADTANPSIDIRGVVAPDRSTALFCLSQVETSVTYPPGRFTLPGLDPERRYTVRVETDGGIGGPGQSPLPWAEHPLTLTGRAIGTVGLQAPVLYPGQLVLLELVPVS
ncbi:MAG: alpha-galactosidase [Mycetocola sp.]